MSSAFTIRPAKIRDFEQLGRLYRQLNPEDPLFADREFAVLQQILVTDALKLVVAEREGGLVGSCYLNITPNLSRGGQPYGLIENVVVDASCRRQGIGRALIDAALDLARCAGCYKVMLLSGRKTDVTRAFYRDCGFDPDAKQAYIVRYPPPQDD